MKDQPFMDVMFVDQAPSADSDPLCPLSGRSGQTVANMLGLSLDRFMDFKRVNLNRHFPGRWPDRKGDFFRAREGDEMALLLMCLHVRKYVLLGQHVQRSFHVEADPLVTVERGDKLFFCLPHPSGLNLWYNSAINFQNASKMLRAFLAL